MYIMRLFKLSKYFSLGRLSIILMIINVFGIHLEIFLNYSREITRKVPGGIVNGRENGCEKQPADG